MNTKEIIKKHEPLLKKFANRYKYLGYDDIYNECVMYLLEAYQRGLKNPEYHVDNKIRKFVKNEITFNNNVFYGLDPNDIKEWEEMINKLLLFEMRQAIRGREKEIIYLYYDYGYTEREIALIIGVSQQRVNAIKQKAISKMKECIK